MIDCDHIHKEIDRAADSPDPQKSFRELEQILETLEDQTAHAEAKVRCLLRRLPTPKLSEEPSWLVPLLQTLNNSESLPYHLIKSVNFLIRHLIAIYGPLETHPKFSRGSNHSLQIEWPGSLVWLVYPSSLTWPAVHIRVYGWESLKVKARTFWYGVTAVEYSMQFLNAQNGC
jgi:hypothetical protein